jgi:predicted nucleotidyltransferase component of viral defense system
VAAFTMAKDEPRNTSASIRQRLLNHSTAIKTDPNLVLIWYGLERFLYRLSVSTHSERFVLKGAMLFRLWGGENFRSTKDLDLEGFLQDEAEVVREVFASICAQPVEDDGLVFDASSVKVTEIRGTQEYGGFRVLLTAKLGTAVLHLQIDVGFGDAITPTPAITEFPSILSQSRPRIRVYPRETVVAEKFEAMVQLGMTNSRMKDYYDLWFMSSHFEFEGPTLAAAMRATFERRGTVIPRLSPIALTVEYAADRNHVRQWAAFSKSLGVEATPGLGVVIDKISEFVLPPAIAAATELPFNQHWEVQNRWQPAR